MPVDAGQLTDHIRAAANRVRAWFQQRLDDQSLDIARLYASQRDRFIARIEQVYAAYLGSDPTLARARQGPAGALIDQAIHETTMALADELGTSAVNRLADVLHETPAQVARRYGAWSALEFGELPEASQRALQELTTSVVGGGTFFDRAFHVTDGLRTDLTRTIRQGLLNGDDFMKVRARAMKLFGVDKLDEPNAAAYGAIRTYRSAAADAWNDLMRDIGEDAGATSVWFATLDDVTTPGCAARHGRPISEVGQPPRHPN